MSWSPSFGKQRITFREGESNVMAENVDSESGEFEQHILDVDDPGSGHRETPKQVPLTEDGLLRIYNAENPVVLGFGGQDVPGDFNAAHYRDSINDLIAGSETKAVSFDLTGVRIVPSGMLGLWVSLTQSGIAISVYNPNKDVRDVLSITKLDRMIAVHDVNLESETRAADSDKS